MLHAAGAHELPHTGKRDQEGAKRDIGRHACQHISQELCDTQGKADVRHQPRPFPGHGTDHVAHRLWHERQKPLVHHR